MNKWLTRLEYKFRRFGIDNLMIYITGTMLFVYLAENLMRLPVSRLISLNIPAVMTGEVWRLVTFIFVPPQNSPLWVLVTLYFYYIIGTSLERTWGSVKFTLFYVIGVIGAIIAAIISGVGTNTYLNLSLFFAFAILFPEHQILLFFVLPVKVKWLGYMYALFLGFALLVGSWTERAAVVMSLLAIIVFFGDIIINKIKNYKRYGKQRRNFRNSMKRQRDIYGD
ncbi:MAG: rhomboid family intramembrane serine protease [Oscillospiraceae bacterium]|nr:rhomboid family intramembrane serine protease [Oscillospiraceae bacterium]